MELHPDSLTHVKGAIADNRHGALFSANLDLDHGLTSGVEVGVRLDGTPALTEARRFLLHAIRHTDLRYHPAPTQRDLDSAYPARWRRPWTFGDTLPVHADETDWHTLSAATHHGPVLYETDGTGPVTPYAGDGQWTLRRNGAMWHLTAIHLTGGQLPVDRMAAWSRPTLGPDRRGTPIPQHGFLTATLRRA